MKNNISLKNISIIILLSYGLSIKAGDYKEDNRKSYQNSTCYKACNAIFSALYWTNIAYYTYSTLNDSDNIEPKEVLTTLTNLASSCMGAYVTSRIINPIIEKIPPLSDVLSCFSNKKLPNEVGGALLFMQDTQTKMLAFSLIDYIKFPEVEASIYEQCNNIASNNTCFDIPKDDVCYRDSININTLFIPKDNRSNSDFPFMHKEYGADALENNKKLFVENTASWLTKCPSCQVSFHYDGKLINDQQYDNTMKLFCHRLNKDEQQRFSLIDIRDNSWIKNNEDLFYSNVSIWVRVDTAKLAITVLNSNEYQYNIFADLDIDAVSKDQILSKNNLLVLKDSPLAFVRAPEKQAIPIENSFFIFKANDAIKEQVIDLFMKPSSSLKDKCRLPTSCYNTVFNLHTIYCLYNNINNNDDYLQIFTDDIKKNGACSVFLMKFVKDKKVLPKFFNDIDDINIDDFYYGKLERKGDQELFNFIVYKLLKDAPLFFKQLQQKALVNDKDLVKIVEVAEMLAHYMNTLPKNIDRNNFCPVIDIPSSVSKKRIKW